MRIGAFDLALVAAISLLPVAAHAYDECGPLAVSSRDGWAQMRGRPGLSGNALWQIPNGTAATWCGREWRDETGRRWIWITYQSSEGPRNGWVAAGLLTAQTAPSAPAPAADPQAPALQMQGDRPAIAIAEAQKAKADEAATAAHAAPQERCRLDYGGQAFDAPKPYCVRFLALAKKGDEAGMLALVNELVVNGDGTKTFDMKFELYRMSQLPDFGSNMPRWGSRIVAEPMIEYSLNDLVVKMHYTAREAPFVGYFNHTWNDMATRGNAVVETEHCTSDKNRCAYGLTSYGVRGDAFRQLIKFDAIPSEYWDCNGHFDTKTGQPVGIRFCNNLLTGIQTLERMSHDGEYFMVKGPYDLTSNEGEMRFAAHERAISNSDIFAAGQPQMAAFKTPEGYCASVGNDDQVKKIPNGLVSLAVRLFASKEAKNEAAAWVRNSTVYRCMDGAVWLCNYGANILCDSKADIRRMTPEILAYCRENPNEGFVPMVVTGHAAAYVWECVRGEARIEQSLEVDTRGFLADDWKRIDQDKTEPSAPALVQASPTPSVPKHPHAPESAFHAKLAPVEDEAVVSDMYNDAGVAIDDAVELVRNAGYRCNSVSSLIPFVFSPLTGGTLKCEHYRYTYEIEDKGGRWIVTVK